jgi:hypothetical protein
MFLWQGLLSVIGYIGFVFGLETNMRLIIDQNGWKEVF